MTLIDFPTPKETWTKPKTLEDWPWEKDLGKPFGDVNGSIANPPEEEVEEVYKVHANHYGASSNRLETNDLARFKDANWPADITDLHTDAVNPPHYKAHPSGVECIQITEHMNFCCGNAVKYIWRHAMKGGKQDLEKAIWYLQRELRRGDQAS
jgi:hypothetical protein